MTFPGTFLSINDGPSLVFAFLTLMYELRILSSPDAVAKVADDWFDLVRGTPYEVFSSPAWYSAYQSAKDIRKVALVCAYKSGSLVGILPLNRQRADYKGLYLSSVTPYAIGDYQPLIVREELAAEVLPLLLDEARKYFGRSSTFWWPFIPEQHPSLPVLRAYYQSLGMHVFEAEETAPKLHINGRSFEELERVWPASYRNDTRRQRRRLAEVGSVTLWEPSTLEEADALLTEFFPVHDEKWLSQGYPGKFQSKSERDLFRAMLHHLWGKGMYFTTIRCGDVNVSYHFGFLAGGWIQWYRPSYRSEYHKYSPGKIHIAMLLEEACQSGLNGFDFLLGEEPYKLILSDSSQKVVSIWASGSSNSPSYWWPTTGKRYLQQRYMKHFMKLRTLIQKAKGTSKSV